MSWRYWGNYKKVECYLPEDDFELFMKVVQRERRAKSRVARWLIREGLRIYEKEVLKKELQEKEL